MGGQTDLQVGSQVEESRIFHAYNWLMRITTDYLRSTCVDLHLVGGQVGGKILASTCIQI